jgi:Rod binding domain-containing protein
MIDKTELLLDTNVDARLPVSKPDESSLKNASNEQKKQFAHDFESLLVTELMDEMKNTIGDWGFEKDGASEQVNGLFWMYMARDVSDKGGLGLWKEIYNVLADSEKQGSAGQLLDNKL